MSGLEKTGELDFSTFLTMMHRQMQQEDPKTEILEALRMTDKQKKGYIQAPELRAKLTMLGEKLTDKEGKRSNINLKLIIVCEPLFQRENMDRSVVQLEHSLRLCNVVCLFWKEAVFEDVNISIHWTITHEFNTSNITGTSRTVLWIYPDEVSNEWIVYLCSNIFWQ